VQKLFALLILLIKRIIERIDKKPSKLSKNSQMSGFLKKILGVNKYDRKDPHFDKVRSELKNENLSTYDDLVELLKPLIKKATKLIVEKPSIPPENSQMKSHFGGQPYFENHEEWPQSKSGRKLNFIFQVFNNGLKGLPDKIKLIQFFYDFEQSPWITQNDGWLVKIYEQINADKLKLISKPAELEKLNYCDFIFEEIDALPDWEGIEIYSVNAQKLSCVLDHDEPLDNFTTACEQLIGNFDNYRSQIGGYPKWIQVEQTPRKPNGEVMDLLFQIKSEENAHVMWGDSGFIYVFNDNDTKHTEFVLQCY
jgi:uncharacterized protein YwqG